MVKYTRQKQGTDGGGRGVTCATEPCLGMDAEELAS